MKKAMLVLVCMVFIAKVVSAAPIVIKWGDPQPNSYSYWPAMQAVKSEVEKKTGGKVEIQLFGSGVLGDTRTLMESTKMGSIQMCCTNSLSVSAFVPDLDVLHLPFIWPNAKVFSDFLTSSQGAALASQTEKAGFKTLSWAYVGFTGIQNTKREIRTPADLKGLKIRTLQNPIMIDSMNAMGGMGVSMGWSEVYSALQQGVIDGAATGSQLLFSNRIYELAKYFTDLKADLGAGMVLMNPKFWSTLPPDVQAAFTEAAKTWTKVNDDYYFDASKATSDQRIVEAFKNAGVKVSEPDSEAFRKATMPVVKKYRDKIGQESVDRVLKFIGYKLE
jgi:TRAP-type transport system periplasmic protein